MDNQQKRSFRGGLNDKEREILKKIYKYNHQLNRYKLSKLFKAEIEKKTIYRLVKKYQNFEYIEFIEEDKISLTELGKKIIEE